MAANRKVCANASVPTYVDLNMETIFSEVTATLPEFKKDPAAVLRYANSRPVAVLEGNRAAFYALEPHLFEAMLDELADQSLQCTAVRRLAGKSVAVEVHIDEI